MRRAAFPLPSRACACACACAALAGCGSCGSRSAGAGAGAAPSGAASVSATAASSVVAEPLPRCRRDADGLALALALAGDDVVVGDVAIGPGGLLVGLIRDDAGKRVASVMRAALDLKTSRVFDVGPAFGDDPPPSPRWMGTTAYVGFLGRVTADAGAGARLRALRLARIEDAALGRVESTVLQQADESTAFDIAWTDGGAGLAAWDEDAPLKDDAGTGLALAAGRGFVKVQPFGGGDGAAERPHVRVASPETSDAESPRLLARPGGFWLAWLAQRLEEDTHGIEGPGESRAFRWVEVTTLDTRGDSTGPVRRVSSEKGRAVGFELAASGADLVVMVEDEAAAAEGAGARVVRHVVGERVESSGVIDGGVGHGLAELVPVASATGGSRWLAWTDTAEHAHMTALGAGLVVASPPSLEPSLDGARVVAAASDGVYALVHASANARPSEPKAGERDGSRPELRRFVCR